jgi:hypothetical protein
VGLVGLELGLIGFKMGLIGFKMGLIGFVFLDTDALSLAFLQKNWLCFAIYPPIGLVACPARTPSGRTLPRRSFQ